MLTYFSQFQRIIPDALKCFAGAAMPEKMSAPRMKAMRGGAMKKMGGPTSRVLLEAFHFVYVPLVSGFPILCCLFWGWVGFIVVVVKGVHIV